MSHKLLHETRWISLYEGFRATIYVAASDGVMAVPLLPDGKVILIQEPTGYGDGALTLLLPSGSIEPGEDPRVSVNRELQEEIGFAAARLDPLGQVQPWVKYLTSSITLYLARDLTPSRLQGDEDYPIVTETVALDSFETLIASGRLRDSSVITALFLARQWVAAEATEAAEN
jgi:8-oxo-dGTP pyrophosphatase MutT (NUDIX family)